MTPKPSEAELAKLEALEKAATPGPWFVLRALWPKEEAYCDGIEAAVPQVTDLGEPWSERCDIVQTDSGVYPPKLPDADLIAAARNALPGLLARIRELEAAYGEALGVAERGLERAEAAEKALGEAIELADERLAHAHQLQADIDGEREWRLQFRRDHGALGSETMMDFLTRLARERDDARDRVSEREQQLRAVREGADELRSQLRAMSVDQVDRALAAPPAPEGRDGTTTHTVGPYGPITDRSESQ